jgi:hypothetical protein
MDSSATLQDFVLNLIYDQDARTAFELDPHGTLEAAGLGDVTAADVQDVLPLVLDYAPLGNVPALDGLTQVDDLTTGVANLDVAGAVAHLQTITAQVSGAPSHLTGDLNIAAASTVTVTADHLVSGVLHTGTGLTGGLTGNLTGSLTGGSGLTQGLFGHTDVHGHAGVGVDTGVGVGGLDIAHDPAAGLDAQVTTQVDHAVADVTYGSDGVVSHATIATTGTLDATVNAVTGVTGSLGVDVSGLDVSGVHEATSSVVGSVLGSDSTGGGLLDGTGVDGVTGAVEHHVSSVTGLVGGLTHTTPATTEPEQTDAGHDLLGGLGLHL